MLCKVIYVNERNSLHLYDLHEERCCTSIVRVKKQIAIFLLSIFTLFYLQDSITEQPVKVPNPLSQFIRAPIIRLS